MKATQAIAMLALSAALAACGGAAVDSAPPMPNDVPVGATASSAAYGEYAGSLAATETGAASEVNQVVPPTSESEQPLPVS